MADGLNLGCLANRFVGLELALRVEKVGRKDGVDEGRLAEAGLALLEEAVAARPGRRVHEHVLVSATRSFHIPPAPRALLLTARRPP